MALRPRVKQLFGSPSGLIRTYIMTVYETLKLSLICNVILKVVPGVLMPILFLSV